MSNAAPLVVQRDRTRDDIEDLKVWLGSLGQQDIKVKLIRKTPKTHQGVNVAGTVDEYDGFVEEKDIQEKHGGGDFTVAIYQRNEKNQLKYVTSRNLLIAGPPKIDALIQAEGRIDGIPGVAKGGDSGDLASQAMSTMNSLLRRAEDKADKASTGFDPHMMNAMQAPLMAQLASLERSQENLLNQIAAKDAQILGLLTQKPVDPPGGTFQEKILGKMIDGESVRIENLRAQHESEIRQLKDGFRQDLDRVHDTAKEELRIRERQHERELDAVKDAQKVASDATKTAHEMRIDGLKSEVKRLETELAATKIELAEQKARKEKTLTEQATEIIKVQEAFKELGVGGKDDEEDKKWYEKLAGAAFDNPDAIGQFIGGIRGNAAPAQPVAQLPPPGQPFTGPDGRVYAMRPDGRAQRLGAGVPAAARKKAAAAKAAVESKEGRPPDPTEVALAITFMESAISNGTDPTIFAQSARSAIPGDVLAYIEKIGIDEWLNGAQLDANSPLRSQSGRNWIRTVARILLEGV